MCITTKNINVPFTNEKGELYWALQPIDECISAMVIALNAAGIYTGESCCGHGNRSDFGYITLHDGRRLVICDSFLHKMELEVALSNTPLEKRQEALNKVFNKSQ